MPHYLCKVIDSKGVVSERHEEGADKRAVIAKLRAESLTPSSVEEQTVKSVEPKASFWKLSGSGSRKMKPAEVLLFTSELSDLIEAGMTLGTALNSLSHQGDPESATCKVAADLRDRILRGEGFSDALDAHPESFPAIYGNMIRAGEASGAMVDVLHRLVEHYERTQNMKSKIISALTYPAIVLGFGVIAVIFAMVKIVPQFTAIFEQMGQTLPFATRLLVAMSEGLLKFGVLYAIGIVFAVVLFKRWINGSGREKWDAFKLKTPFIKGIIASGAFASLAYTLQTLLANGVNVLNALRICEETAGNAIISKELKYARSRVTDGTSISGPLAQSGVFPRMMTDMMALGEQTGDLPGALEHIGKRYEMDLERNIKIFTTALEPILIIFVAVMVGFVAVSILSAVFSATASMGK